MQHLANAGLLAQSIESTRCTLEQIEGIAVATMLARDFSHCRLAGRPAVRIVESLRKAEDFAVDLLSAIPVAYKLEDFAEIQQHVDALALLEQRCKTLVVVDRGRIRIGGLRCGSRTAKVFALLVEILAVA